MRGPERFEKLDERKAWSASEEGKRIQALEPLGVVLNGSIEGKQKFLGTKDLFHAGAEFRHPETSHRFIDQFV